MPRLARGNKRPVAVTAALLRRWQLPKPGSSADKFDRGVALVIGGATEIPGAPLLAAVAAVRAGVGKIQVAAPRSAAIALGVALPEARVFSLPESEDGSLDRQSGAAAGECSKDAGAILIGPGMLNEDAVHGFMDEFLGRVREKLLVIDAVALTAFRGGRHKFSGEPRVVLTPNLNEMARLTGEKPETVSADARGVAVRVARDLNVVVALKGSETFIATPNGEVFRYDEGGEGLATSGSGDVLAGALVGLLARGATLDQAAAWAVYLHGAAGNRLKRRIGTIGFLARELCDEIAPVMNSLAGGRAS